MKQTVTDIQDIRTELDTEDEQLMRMFPRSRAAALEDMLLVQKGGEMYLLRKEDVARSKKIVNCIIWMVIGFVCTVYLLCAVMSAITGNGNGGVYLLIFELLLFPYIAKVPKEVRGGVHP